MASFNLLDFLAAFLGGFNVPDLETRVTAWLAAEGENYPDIKERTAALSAWLTTVLEEAAPNLDPAAMALSIKAIAASIVNGTAGNDPDSWIFG